MRVSQPDTPLLGNPTTGQFIAGGTGNVTYPISYGWSGDHHRSIVLAFGSVIASGSSVISGQQHSAYGDSCWAMGQGHVLAGQDMVAIGIGHTLGAGAEHITDIASASLDVCDGGSAFTCANPTAANPVLVLTEDASAFTTMFQGGNRVMVAPTDTTLGLRNSYIQSVAVVGGVTELTLTTTLAAGFTSGKVSDVSHSNCTAIGRQCWSDFSDVTLVGDHLIAGKAECAEVGYTDAGKIRIDVNGVLFTQTPPAATDSPGVAGTMVVSGDYIYVCIAANSWKRLQLTAW